MTSETRPVCVYALAGLKRNSKTLLIVMCIGIALALYGVYVQYRTQSNPNYMPPVSVATNWFYNSFGQRLMRPSSLFKNCIGSSAKNAPKPTFGQQFMYRFIYPVTRYSGLVNGMLNVAQIVLLKTRCKSIMGTDAIIGLSAFGFLVSMLCLVGSFATCKLMCISCLGIHHMLIVYLSIRRRKMLKNILCPTENLGACTFGSGNSGGSSGSNSNNSNSNHSSNNSNKNNANPIVGQPATGAASKHASSCTTRRRPDTAERRRSDRT